MPTSEPLVYSPALNNAGVIVHACNVSTGVVGTGRSEVQAHPQLYREFKTSMEYTTPCLRKRVKR